jgi:hypothetical protein
MEKETKTEEIKENTVPPPSIQLPPKLLKPDLNPFPHLARFCQCVFCKQNE